jgi:16S rRNA (guanine966-N2)-methyltransferase
MGVVMRVIAGRYRGTTLRCGRGPFYRPTAQIVKGSIFDTLGSAVTGARFLDLFAGSGAIGIEALSRGASQAVFVEQDRRILKALRTNLQRCRIAPDQAIVLGHDAFRFLDRLKAGGEFFDIIFADPPYAGATAQRVVEAVMNAGRAVCRQLVVEHGEPIKAGEDGPLGLHKEKRFGQTRVSYFKNGAERETEGKEGGPRE